MHHRRRRGGKTLVTGRVAPCRKRGGSSGRTSTGVVQRMKIVRWLAGRHCSPRIAKKRRNLVMLDTKRTSQRLLD
jgi:hypothetical protein